MTGCAAVFLFNEKRYSMGRLKFGMVGGGIGSFIGSVHREAAWLGGAADLAAGSFSRNPAKNEETARQWGLPDLSRVYGSYGEMAAAEAKREDGIDFVVIATPNDTHFEAAKAFLERGIHVMCDKPVTRTVEEAQELGRLAEAKGCLFGVSYGYTGYPVIRQAREMIREGKIGEVLHVRVTHPEDWVIETDFDNMKTLPWRFRPEIVGGSLCTGDLGTHAEQLLVQFTGLHIRRVLAMFDHYPAQVPLETNTTALLQLENGATGQLWASQIAIGKLCDPEIYVVGTKGSLEWSHNRPDVLRFTQKGGPTMELQAGKPYMKEESSRLSRVASGHHEGFLEAFASIYQSYCEVLRARREGRSAPGYAFPTIEDGIDGMRFVRACVESHQKGNVWIEI